MKFIPPWLVNFHFHADPYSCPQAESLEDAMIRDLFVPKVFEPKYLDPDLNILNYPGSTVIYGWGKTMALRWLLWWAGQAREGSSTDFFPMVVPYTHFLPLVRLPDVTMADHVAPLMSAFAAAFLPLLSEDKVCDKFLSQPPAYRQNWWAFLNQYLPAHWERMEELSCLPGPLLEDLHGSASASPSGVDRLPVEGELDQVLSRLTGWLAVLGINRVYVVVENITGYLETKKDKRAARLVAPLLENDQLFHTGIIWKIFLSGAVEEAEKNFFPRVGYFPLRYKIYQIRWEPGTLVDMLDKTIQYCSEPPYNNLSDLCDRQLLAMEPPPVQQLADLALRYPGSPPKNMLNFVSELLKRVYQNKSKMISIDIWNAFFREFSETEQPVEKQPGGLKRADAGDLPRSSDHHGLENKMVALIQELEALETKRDYTSDSSKLRKLTEEIFDVREKIEKMLQEAGEGPSSMTNSAREAYTEKRIESLQKRIKRLTEDLENQEDQHDYAHDLKERKHSKHHIDETKEDIEEALKEVESLSSHAAESQQQALNASRIALVDMEQRVQELEAEMEAFRAFIDRIPADAKEWAAQVYNRIDQAYFQDMLDLLATADDLPEAETKSLVEAVEQARVPAEKAGTDRAKLVEQGKDRLNAADGAYQTRLKISIPIIPLLLSFESEVGLDGKLSLRALWDAITRRAKDR